MVSARVMALAAPVIVTILVIAKDARRAATFVRRLGEYAGL